jgi:hypothetical protein
MSHRFARVFTVAAAAALLLILAVPGWATQVNVYAQPTNLGGAYTSQNDSVLGNFATAYDNFTLGTATAITSMDWTGSFNPAAGTITGFTVEFWSNSGNAPNTLLSTFNISGNANQAFISNDTVGNPTYSYSATINFAAAAGTEYWISIVASLNGPPQWGWETGTGGDGQAYQCFNGACGNISSDLAFDLFKTQQIGTPEPGSLILLGTGILGLAGTLRRKLF